MVKLVADYTNSQGKVQRWSFSSPDSDSFEEEFRELMERINVLRRKKKEDLNQAPSVIPVASKQFYDSHHSGSESWSETIKDSSLSPSGHGDGFSPPPKQLVTEEPSKPQKTEQPSKIINFPHKKSE